MQPKRNEIKVSAQRMKQPLLSLLWFRSKRGSTLIEAAMAMGITASFLVVGAGGMVQHKNIQENQSVRLLGEQSNQIAIGYLMRRLRDAGKETIKGVGGGTFNTKFNGIEFQIPTGIDFRGENTYGGSAYGYRVDATKKQFFEVYPSTSSKPEDKKILANNVKEVSFEPVYPCDQIGGTYLCDPIEGAVRVSITIDSWDHSSGTEEIAGAGNSKSYISTILMARN